MKNNQLELFPATRHGRESELQLNPGTIIHRAYSFIRDAGGEGATVAEIADRIGAKVHTTHARVNELEEAGLVQSATWRKRKYRANTRGLVHFSTGGRVGRPVHEQQCPVCGAYMRRTGTEYSWAWVCIRRLCSGRKAR